MMNAPNNAHNETGSPRVTKPKTEEKVRERQGLGDNLPRDTRQHCKKQYSKAVELLRSDRYITTQEVADSCGVSYAGLEQQLLFYHKDLVKRRIKIREKAVGQKRKGEITGRGTLHPPSPETKEKYAEAVRLYATTPMSALRIAKMTGISRNRFYDYLHNNNILLPHPNKLHHRFERDGDDAQQQVVDVFRVVVLAAPVVRVILNPILCSEKASWRNLFRIWANVLIVQDYIYSNKSNHFTSIKTESRGFIRPSIVGNTLIGLYIGEIVFK